MWTNSDGMPLSGRLAEIDPVLAGLAGLGLLLVVAVGLLIRRAEAARREAAERDERLERTSEWLTSAQMELSGRMQQMAESQAIAQAQLGRSLDARLEAVSHRLGQNLHDQASRTQQTLTTLHERLAVIDEAQRNLTDLSQQMVSLQDILSNKQSRGAFGEIQMNDLVRAALPPSAYEFQVTLSNRTRADCLLRLPNPPGPIVIDSKFPLESFLALRDATDEAGRVQAGRAFAADVRTHVHAVAAKYIVPGETAESALLFLPSEAVYAELHANFRNVVEESFRLRVWIVSPTTLMATLNTVRAVLKDVRMREQAGVIQKEVLALLEDVTRLDDRVARLQRHFEQSGEDVRQIRISTEKVAKRAERIESVQLGEESPAEDLAPAKVAELP